LIWHNPTMTRFRYRALAASGEIKAGVLEAETRASLLDQLQAQGYFPIDATEPRASALGQWRRRLSLPSRPPPRRALGVAMHQLATLLKAGVPLDRALGLLARQSSSPRLKPVLAALFEAVRRGTALSDAMRAHPTAFPAAAASLVEAGEAGGTMGTSLSRLTEMMLKADALRDTVASALLYPLLLVIMAILSLVIILTVVLPEFAPLFQDAGAILPWPTQIVIALGDLIAQHWLLGLAIVAGFCLIVRQLFRADAARLRLDALLLRLPILGAGIAKAETARFARTLGTLYDNGVPLPAALGITRRAFGNRAMGLAVERVAAGIKEGGGLAAPLAASGLFPLVALDLIRVGEETSKLGEMLTQLADLLDQDLQHLVQRGLALMVPLLTIAMGVLIAGLIASILVGILSLNDLAIDGR
jgi:general secretion pathway protein F